MDYPSWVDVAKAMELMNVQVKSMPLIEIIACCIVKPVSKVNYWRGGGLIRFKDSGLVASLLGVLFASLLLGDIF